MTQTAVTEDTIAAPMPQSSNPAKLSQAVGSLAWARRTGGKLSSAERLRMTLQGISAQLKRVPRQLRRKLGLPRASAPLELDALAAPDSPVAKAAEQALADSSPTPLVHHCYRSYAWGRVLATGRGITLDTELFYVAALLHDLGLGNIEQAPGSCCFALDGAEAALRVLDAAGWDPARSATVAEAISLHLNVRVPLRHHGAEAHFLNAATALDVIGLGLGSIPAEHQRQVLQVHPRDGWNDTIQDLLRQQVRSRPGSRIHFLAKTFGFLHRAAQVRFAS